MIFSQESTIQDGLDLLMSDRGTIFILKNWDRIGYIKQREFKNYFSVENFENPSIQRIVMGHRDPVILDLAIRNLAYSNQEKIIPEVVNFFKGYIHSANESYQLAALTFFSRRDSLDDKLVRKISLVLKELEEEKRLPTKLNNLKRVIEKRIVKLNVIKCYNQIYNSL